MVPGMTQPVLLFGPNIQMTTEALAARVQGSMLVRCALTVDGAVTQCNVIKSLPFMDETVVRVITTRPSPEKVRAAMAALTPALIRAAA